MMMEYLSIVFLGLGAGVLSGLFGIAGGTLLVPGLMLLGGADQVTAVGTSLAGNLLPVGLLGVLHYYRKGLIHLRLVLPLALGLLAGTGLGSLSAVSLPPFWHKITYGLFLAGLSARFFLAAPPRSPLKEEQAPLWGLGLTGLSAGLLSGLFGIGGGAVIVPVLTEVFKIPQRKATATSLGALLLPVGLPAVLHYGAENQVQWGWAGIIALGMLVGAFVGARIQTKTKDEKSRFFYAVYLGLIGAGFLGAAMLSLSYG